MLWVDFGYKFVTPEGMLGQFRLGLNFEIALDSNGNWGGEIRPILAFENRRIIAAINPNIGFPGASAEPGEYLGLISTAAALAFGTSR